MVNFHNVLVFLSLITTWQNYQSFSLFLPLESMLIPSHLRKRLNDVRHEQFTFYYPITLQPAVWSESRKKEKSSEKRRRGGGSSHKIYHLLVSFRENKYDMYVETCYLPFDICYLVKNFFQRKKYKAKISRDKSTGTLTNWGFKFGISA